MKKIFIRVTLTLLSLVALYGVGRLIDVSYGSYQFVERHPYMVMQTKNSITLKWQSDKEEIGSVAYGLTPDALTNVLFEQSATNKHHITLPKLQECSRYFYSVNSPSMSIDNEGRSFTTLCESAKTQRLWAIGDSGQLGKNQTDVYAKAMEYIDGDYSKLDMWLLLGDNAYSSGTQEQFNTKLFEPYKELVKRFTPWAVIGNHDARRWAFYNIFEFPANAQSGGVASHAKEYYAIDNGNLHLVMLDSESVDRDSDGDMANWLREDLAANKKPWVIVVFHTPPYSDGGHKSDDDWDSFGRLKDMRENFVPIFDEYGVDLVLGGHSHGYERSKLLLNHLRKSDTLSEENILQDRKTDYIKSLDKKRDSGTIYQVCGSSSKLDGATYAHPALPYSLHEMGSLMIEITPTTLTSKFINIDGKIADEFTIIKKKDDINEK